MKKTFLLFLIVFSAVFAYSQTEKYSKIKIYTDDNGLQKLSKLGLAVDEGICRKGVYFISDFSETEIKVIRSNGFKFDILVDDVLAHYLKTNQEYANKPLTGDPKLSAITRFRMNFSLVRWVDIAPGRNTSVILTICMLIILILFHKKYPLGRPMKIVRCTC